ncbi:hypothetical protein MMC30_004872 [Trapelia coarctata]|nr:hypothetical protein [Trapelia coarctata]
MSRRPTESLRRRSRSPSRAPGRQSRSRSPFRVPNITVSGNARVEFNFNNGPYNPPPSTSTTLTSASSPLQSLAGSPFQDLASSPPALNLEAPRTRQEVIEQSLILDKEIQELNTRRGALRSVRKLTPEESGFFERKYSELMLRRSTIETSAPFTGRALLPSQADPAQQLRAPQQFLLQGSPQQTPQQQLLQGSSQLDATHVANLVASQLHQFRGEFQGELNEVKNTIQQGVEAVGKLLAEFKAIKASSPKQVLEQAESQF